MAPGRCWPRRCRLRLPLTSSSSRDQLDENGHRLVVRNGYHQPRDVLTAAGAVEVTAPRVNDKRVDPDSGERQRFSSAILPAWARKSPQISEVLPLLYLHGLSTGTSVPALEQFLGSGAGLSASTITRLTAQWQEEAARVRPSGSVGHRLRLPVGRRHPPQGPPGADEAVPVGDDRGARRWPQGTGRADRRVIGSRASRGPICCVVVAGAAWPPRCWPSAMGRSGSGRRCGRCSRRPVSSAAGSTRQANVLAALPKSAHPAALSALKEIYNAEDIDKAQVAVKAFEVDYGAKYPKAVAKIVDDLDVLLEFYHYPAEHWIHLRTTNPIESTFATVRLRTKVTKGPDHGRPELPWPTS